MITMAESGRQTAQREEMLPLLTRHKIQVLLDARHTQESVAEHAGVSLSTVKRVKREAEVTDTDDATSSSQANPVRQAPPAARERS